MRDENKLLFIIDGAKGLRKGIQKVFGRQASYSSSAQACVIAYLPKSQQSIFRKKLRKAYQKKSYKQAKMALNSIRKELNLINQSAVNSLDEGFEETITLHRLRVFKQLGISLKTTNCIESLNSQLGQYTHRVSYWKNSNQRQRWVATALLEIEPSLRKIKGYKYLPLLRQAMKRVGEKQILAKVA